MLPGTDGKVLVDAGYATSQRQVREALNGISRDPLKHLIDTHWHFDHTDGNGWLNAAGATIIAHENTRKRLTARQEIPAFHGIFPPSRPGLFLRLFSRTNEAFASMAKRFFSNTIPPRTRIATSR